MGVLTIYDIAGDIGRDKPQGVETSHQRNSHPESVDAGKAESIHTALLTEVVVANEPHFPEPADSTKVIVRG